MIFRSLSAGGSATGSPPPNAKGFSIFGATREDYRAFLRACRRTGLRCPGVVGSGISPGGTLLPREIPAVAVFQDLPPDSPILSLLTRQLVYPAWHYGIPVCFFSRPQKDEYLSGTRCSDRLHEDLDAVERHLFRGQLIGLLGMQELPPDVRRGLGAGSARGMLSSVACDYALDQSQLNAVRHAGGPMRVLAPAGSGKTRTIVQRIVTLVRSGVPPENILPLAFNRKAASEMNDRLAARGFGRVRARTFHSLGYEIVRSASAMRFSAQEESLPIRALMAEAILAVSPAVSRADSEALDRAMRLLGSTKMDLLPLDGLSVRLDGSPAPFGPLFHMVLRLQQERCVMTYDDMIYFALRILLDDGETRRRYQAASTYILVDEFQDLNRAQLLLLQALALPENNLFVVGDDDQAIYGWRGANVGSILEFPRRYSCAKECLLSTNYRSSTKIVAHAGWLIGRNLERVPKRVLTRTGAPPGEFIVRVSAGLWEQAESAAGWIVEQRNAGGGRWSDFAVLYRYNAHQFVVALALDRRRVPHTSPVGSRLFDSGPGRDIAAWLRILLAPGAAGPADLRRVLSRPKRFLPREVVGGLDSWSDLEALSAHAATPVIGIETVRELVAGCGPLREKIPLLSPHEFIEELDAVVHLRQSYGKRKSMRSDPDEADDLTYIEVIDAVSREFSSAGGLLAHIGETHGQADVTGRQDEAPAEGDAVVLRTIHRAKGNEFHRVVLFDMSRKRRLEQRDLEEERRVAYVGLTRARESLFITANGRRLSPFLLEAALNPRYAGRMREDMESELRALRKGGSRRAGREIASLDEELRCRSMLSRPPCPS